MPLIYTMQLTNIFIYFIYLYTSIDNLVFNMLKLARSMTMLQSLFRKLPML